MIILVDGRNTAYRTVFAAHGNEDFAKHHLFATWLRFASDWMIKFKPDMVYVCWDASRSTLWRNKILPEYKGNRTKFVEDRGFDVGAEIGRLESVAKAVLPKMGVGYFERDGQEADDLIYAACRVLAPNKIVIVSSDKDFVQIPWLMPHVSCYDPMRKIVLSVPECNPVIQKCLMGDNSDNIAGYPGIGIVRSANLTKDFTALHTFLKARGPEVFQRNMVAIDLSLNPHRMANELYVLRKLAEPTIFDKKAVFDLIAEHKIRGLTADFPQYVLPFKFMLERSQPRVDITEGDSDDSGSNQQCKADS